MEDSPLIRLLVMLEDEFRDSPGVRVRVQSPSTTRRSPDLEQDYDPHAAQVHRVAGVKVQAANREYFFPEEWIHEPSRARIQAQLDLIREQVAGGRGRN